MNTAVFFLDLRERLWGARLLQHTWHDGLITGFLSFTTPEWRLGAHTEKDNENSLAVFPSQSPVLQVLQVCKWPEPQAYDLFHGIPKTGRKKAIYILGAY